MLQLLPHLVVSALNLSLDQELQTKLAKLCIFPSLRQERAALEMPSGSDGK